MAIHIKLKQLRIGIWLLATAPEPRAPWLSAAKWQIAQY